MKKLIISTAAIVMAFSFSAIAGTPENNKSEVKTGETATLITYHVTQDNGDGTVEFAEGPGANCEGQGELCEWQSSTPMVSPQATNAILTNPNVNPASIKRFD